MLWSHPKRRVHWSRTGGTPPSTGRRREAGELLPTLLCRLMSFVVSPPVIFRDGRETMIGEDLGEAALRSALRRPRPALQDLTCPVAGSALSLSASECRVRK